jgi:hypothetical protein
MRNLQEGATTSARTMFHGRKGELRHGDRDGMEDQLAALGLILNAVPAWTRTRTGRARCWRSRSTSETAYPTNQNPPTQKPGHPLPRLRREQAIPCEVETNWSIY